MNELTRKQAAELAKKFAETEFGDFMLMSLGQKYNDLHHDAEGSSLTIEQKAMLIERAAGLKLAIDFVMVRVEAAKRGDFKDDKE